MARGKEHLRQHPLNYKIADAVYGVKLRPGQYGPNFWINKQGFPQREPVRQHAREGALRIVCLGESPTLGIDSVRSFPSFLQGALERNSASYHSYEVINAAVPGWSSDQTALRVKRELARLKPDMVVFYVGLNDFQAYNPLAQSPQKSTFEQTFGAPDWDEPEGVTAPWLAALKTLTGKRTLQTETANRSPACLYRFLLQNLNRIVGFFRASNPHVKFVVCTLAARWPKDGSEQWKVAPEVWWAEAHQVSWRGIEGYLGELNHLLAEFAVAQHASIVDINSVFLPLDRERLFWDMGHLTSRGLEIMAGAIYQHMCDRGLISGRADSRYATLIAKYGATRSQESTLAFEPARIHERAEPPR